MKCLSQNDIDNHISDMSNNTDSITSDYNKACDMISPMLMKGYPKGYFDNEKQEIKFYNMIRISDYIKFTEILSKFNCEISYDSKLSILTIKF